MAILSALRKAVRTLAGLNLVHRGKVRDTYDLGHGLLLIVATDAISVFDFVLNMLVPDKGYVLNAMTHFWFVYLEGLGIRTHLVAAGADIDQYLPPHLRGDTDLQKRAMVVRKLRMLEWEPGIGIEFVFRAYLTGGGLKEYNECGSVCGVALPPGLQDGDKLDTVIFTPTTKPPTGKDIPIPSDAVMARYPAAVELARHADEAVTAFCLERGIVKADGKWEIFADEKGVLYVGDEGGTPDCSRFWELVAWLASRKMCSRKAPPSFDKQYVRNAAKLLDVDKLKADSEDDAARVQALQFPDTTITETTRLYREIFSRITGMSLEEYWCTVFCIG